MIAIKDLFHFSFQEKKEDKKSNTLFRYNFRKKNKQNECIEFDSTHKKTRLLHSKRLHTF